MKRKTLVGAVCMFALILAGIDNLSAADKKAVKSDAKGAPLTAEGEKLLSQYSEILKTLQAEIAKAVPAVDGKKTAVFKEAREAVKKAKADMATAQKPFEKIAGAEALVGHAKGKWIGGAEKGIAQAEETLKKAATEAEREAAKKDLAKWQANKEDGLKALKERQALLDAAKADEAKYTEVKKAAQAALDDAVAKELKAAKDIITDVMPFLSSDKLDAKLVKCAVLSEATPNGLAEFAQQGKDHEALLEKLLGDTNLMKEMLEAGGAKDGKYGQAMKIYTDIQKAGKKADKGILQQLALGTSLEHAVPIKQSNPAADTAAPSTVDPVKRYLHYEKAYLDGELDKGFKDLTAWEYRNAVNGDEPDSILAWGREMLRNYRPDHILNSGYGWRYSGVVRTDVKYGSQDVKNDRPTLQNYQNIILNGGVCGRRAFFGRFILRCFGIPAVARPQTGHAALAHWTPEGWVINLGAGWGSGRIGNSPDTDFLLNTQARKYPKDYQKVLRAQWVGYALGEEKYDGRKDGSSGLWNTIVFFEKKAIVAETKPQQLAALGTELGEANESAEAKLKAVAKATVTDADKKIVTGSDGVITIPAAACSGAQIMNSFLGGQQMVVGGNGTVTCAVDVPGAGKYALSARVVTVHGEGNIQLTTNAAKDPVTMVLPFTVGMWEKTKPAEISLVNGKNTISLSKPSAAFAIKDFTLTPLR